MHVTRASVRVYRLVCTLVFVRTWGPEDSVSSFKPRTPCFWGQDLSSAGVFGWVGEAGWLVGSKGLPVFSLTLRLAKLPASFFFFFFFHEF